MKIKSVIFTIILFISLAAATSCSNENKGYIDINKEDLNIVLSGTSQKTIPFQASDEWYVRIYYNGSNEVRWLNVTPTSGEASVVEITLQAQTLNYTEELRSADVVIKLPGRANVTIHVEQPPVTRPKTLLSLTRALSSGGVIKGPSEIAFGYDEKTGKVNTFTTKERQLATQYTVKTEATKGTITSKTTAGEASFEFTMSNNRIYDCGPLEWIFKDTNSNLLMKRSSVTFNFRYDNSENKLLKSVTRSETIEVEEGATLPVSRQEKEIYNYTYDNLRIEKIAHTLPYDVTSEVEQRDTIIYTLHYPTDESLVQENNLTANVWDLLVLPENQGVPFYSPTGYWMLGLTGIDQGSLPESISVELKIHSADPETGSWPSQFLYSYQKSAELMIETANTNINYTAGGAAKSVVMQFTYEQSWFKW